MQPKAVLLDLDNTLYDWSAYFSRSFRATAFHLSQLADLSFDTIVHEASDVFRRHKTVEYGFWIQELPSLVHRHPEMRGHELARLYWPAVETFKSIRREMLVPYPGVVEGLATLRAYGCTVVAVTDAMHWHSEHRLAAIGLTDFVDWLVARPDYELPSHTDFDEVSSGSDLPIGPERFVGLPDGIRKPDPEVVRYIARSLRTNIKATVVVGDSLPKDIAMAQAAGAPDVWAAYGTAVAAEDMDLLSSISDWSAADVEVARNPAQMRAELQPSHVAWNFHEVVSIVEQHT